MKANGYLITAGCVWSQKGSSQDGFQPMPAGQSKTAPIRYIWDRLWYVEKHHKGLRRALQLGHAVLVFFPVPPS